MALTLRYSTRESVLRSSGDPPIGVVGVAFPERRAVLMVTPVFDPLIPGSERVNVSELGMAPEASPLDPELAAAACVDGEALRRLYGIPCRALLETMPVYLAAQEFELIQTALDLVREVGAAVEGELRKRAEQ